MTTFTDLPLDLLLLIATVAADYRAFAALSLAVPRLGRALIVPFDAARWQDTLTPDQRAATRAVFCETIYIVTSYGLAVVTRLAGQLHSFGDAPSVVSLPDCPPGITPLLQSATPYERELRFFHPDCRLWHRHGKMHRDQDQPAAVHPDMNTRIWMQNDEYHRNGDLPAVINPFTQCWYQHGKLHRDGDQPATVYDNGDQEWYVNGSRHREGDQPAIVRKNGQDRWWYRHGMLHRENDQPAIDRDALVRMWYVNGLCHRGDDQPAVVYPSGGRMWYVNGELHRDHDRPARIIDHGRHRGWYRRGQLHRDSNRPALVSSTGNDYYQHGQWVAPPVQRRSARLAARDDAATKRTKEQ